MFGKSPYYVCLYGFMFNKIVYSLVQNQVGLYKNYSLFTIFFHYRELKGYGDHVLHPGMFKSLSNLQVM